MPIALSCCIPTLNEEQNIEKCIKSILWVDEIIVLDSGSTDKTVEIAKSLGANVYFRKWDNTANQFSYLFNLAQNEWVLHLDADEVCSVQLHEEIAKLLENNIIDKYDAYLVNRKTFFFNKWIKRCGLYPDYGLRLFKKSKIKLTHKGFHHRAHISGSIGTLPKDAVILHYSITCFEQYLDKVKREALEMAKWRFENKERFSALKLIFKSLFNFLKRYIFQGGFLAGKTGFIISIMSSLYISLQYLKLWEFEESK